MGVGYADTPGIWSDDQVDGWKIITSTVHAAGGRMMLQLWHVGRISDPVFLDGATPVAPSAIQPQGHVSLIRPEKPFVTPRALELNEIAGVIETYRKGAENAKKAGFDGVEIHGANGYLLDPIPAGQRQPADRSIRRPDRKSRPADAGSHRCRHQGMGRGSGRHASGPREPTSIRWAIPTDSKRSVTSHASLASVRSLSSPHANTPAMVASDRNSRKRSAGSISPTKNLLTTPPLQRSRPARRMPSRSGNCLLQIRIWSRDLKRARRSTSRITQLSMHRAKKDMWTIYRWRTIRSGHCLRRRSLLTR